MATKITKAQNFNAIREILVDVDRPDLVAVIDHELELIANKAAKRASTPTKAQKEGAVLREVILNLLTVKGERMTIKEMQAESDALAELTSQKISAQLKKLIDEKIVERIVDKRVKYYKAV